MLGISDQSAGRRAVRDLHAARAGRNAEAGHAADAVVPARLVAGREVPRLHRRQERRVRHLPDRRPTAAATEIRLTDFKGLDDGPEYTPDGKYIYFNSTRSGTMQIWRMKPDGTRAGAGHQRRLQQLVPAHLAGRPVDRLHHASRRRSSPTDHPYYKHVYLRLMPVDGGAAERDRLRLRRPGHDQRAVVVARQQEAGLRQQLGPAVGTAGQRLASPAHGPETRPARPVTTRASRTPGGTPRAPRTSAPAAPAACPAGPRRPRSRAAPAPAPRARGGPRRCRPPGRRTRPASTRTSARVAPPRPPGAPAPPPLSSCPSRRARTGCTRRPRCVARARPPDAARSSPPPRARSRRAAGRG